MIDASSDDDDSNNNSANGAFRAKATVTVRTGTGGFV